MKGQAKGSIEVLPSGKYRVTWYPPQGNRVRRTFSSEEDAELWLAERRIEVKRGVWQPPAKPLPLLEYYAECWVAQRRNRKGEPLKPRTRAHYRQMLAHDFGPLAGLRLDEITPPIVRGWYATMDAHPAQQANAYALLSAVMHTAVADELIVKTPCLIRGGAVKDRASATTPLTPNQVLDLAEAMPLNLRAIIHVAAFGGLREGELFELRRGDVDPEGAWVSVRRAVTHTKGEVHIGSPKSDAGNRVTWLPPHVAPILRDHLALWVGPSEEALVFTSSRGNRLRPSTLYRHYYRARKAIGRQDLRFHDLRHTGGTLATQAGATLREVQRRLGHSTVTAAMRYQHATDERDVEIAARIGAQVPTRLKVVGE